MATERSTSVCRPGVGGSKATFRKYVLVQSKAKLWAVERPVLLVDPPPLQHQVVASRSHDWTTTEELQHEVTV